MHSLNGEMDRHTNTHESGAILEEESKKRSEVGKKKTERSKTEDKLLRSPSNPVGHTFWRNCQDTADLPPAEPLVNSCRHPRAAAILKNPRAGCGQPLSEVSTGY